MRRLHPGSLHLARPWLRRPAITDSRAARCARAWLALAACRRCRREHADLSAAQSVRAGIAQARPDLHIPHQCLQVRRSQLKSSPHWRRRASATSVPSCFGASSRIAIDRLAGRQTREAVVRDGAAQAHEVRQEERTAQCRAEGLVRRGHRRRHRRHRGADQGSAGQKKPSAKQPGEGPKRAELPPDLPRVERHHEPENTTCT